MRLLVLLLLALPAYGQVSITVGNCSANDECDLTITGSGEVTLSVIGGAGFDWFRFAPDDYVSTQPELGVNGDGLNAAEITFAAPVSGRLDMDGTRTGLALTVGGVTVELAESAGTWAATFEDAPVYPVDWVWGWPDTYTDDTPIEDGALTAFEIRCAASDGGAVTQGVSTDWPAASTVLALPLGEWYCHGVARTGDAESEPVLAEQYPLVIDPGEPTPVIRIPRGVSGFRAECEAGPCPPQIVITVQ